MTEQFTHGGRREGAGRKPNPNKRVLMAFRIPVNLADRLRQEDDQTALITELLRKHYAPE